MTNRFEQVDELQDDAMNLSFAQTAEGQTGRVRIPVEIVQGKLPGGVDSVITHAHQPNGRACAPARILIQNLDESW